MGKRRWKTISPGADLNVALASGAPLRLRPGQYPHDGLLVIPNGAMIVGDGIGQCEILAQTKWGSECWAQGFTVGKRTSHGGHRFADGAENSEFVGVRFRAPGSAQLIDMCDFSRWSEGPIYILSPKRKCNARDFVFTNCEYEFNGTAGSCLWNVWWDVRDGGGSFSGFEWYNCTWGVRNAAGQWSGMNGGATLACHLLVQPAPAEHGSGGPRPGSTVVYGWDRWDECTHGAGLASEHPDPTPFVLSDCRMVGKTSLADFDLCCNTRSYWYTTAKNPDGSWRYTPTYIGSNANCTEGDRAVTPDHIGTNRGWELSNVWFGGDFRPEIGPRDNPQYGPQGQRLENYPDKRGPEYNVSDRVLAHDKALYGL